MPNQDWVNEMKEFANCARIFKGTSDMIASRFTSSKSTVSQVKTSDGKAPEDPDILIHRPSNSTKELSPAEQAAKMGMYGPLTRTIEEFWPSRLLCKRFNVRPPMHVESAAKKDGKTTESSSTPGFDAATFARMAQQTPQATATATTTTRQPPTRGPKEIISKEDMTTMMRSIRGDENFELPTQEKIIEEEKKRVDVEVNDALEAERPSDDVFKAIFGDDSDSDG